MNSRFKTFLWFAVLLLATLACSSLLGSMDASENGYAGAGNYYPAAEEPSSGYEDEEPSAEEPILLFTPTPQPTATFALTSLPDTGGGNGPAPTPIAVSMDLNTIYARVVEQLPEGSALFNPPEVMRVGEVKVVEVRVVPMTGEEIEEDEQIKATLTADMEEVDEVIVIPLRVSTVMSARLTGAAFEILRLTQEEQIRTSDSDYLSWTWEVTPQKSGEQMLTLHLSVVVNAEGMGDRVHTTTEVRRVQVQSNPIYSVRQFFGTNWEWVVTGLLFPAGGWILKKVRDRRVG